MKAKNSATLTGLWCLALLVCWLAAPAAAQGEAPDVGIVTRLSGEASFAGKGEPKTPGKVQAFMKVRQGDELKLAPGGVLTLLYFGSGRQETWKGPVTFVAGAAESTAQAEGELIHPPEIKMLPVKATKRMAAAPISPASASKSGAIQTMGARPATTAPTISAPPVQGNQAKARLKEASQVYQDLKKTAAKDDLTPELYYLSVLTEFKRYRDMDIVVDAMLRKRPGDPALRELKAWVRSQAATAR